MALNLSPFQAKVEQKGLRIFTVRVLQRGEPAGAVNFAGAEDIRRLQHSVSKSFTSMAAGLALQEGLVDLDTRVGDIFPEAGSDRACTSESLNPARIRLIDLLRMSSGHDTPPLTYEERAVLEEPDWVKHYLSQPLDRPPGELFTYSSGDTYMISAMLEAVTGQTVKDYLVPRLFEPLGIEGVRWDTCPLGRTLGCTGLYLTTEELSRFGEFLLRRGEWKGRQLVSSAWIELATSKQVATPEDGGDWGIGYGYQFWRCTHGAYRADGMYGQFCIVLPERDAVIAINSQEDKMQGILDAVWEEIYPLL
ncbi:MULTISPECIES: serine hydrolase [Paenibacillus]|uniref:serine hydrolase domain-containing protein n=1 Tax=Paenibacillus TaxID=44249 RepID=UPI002FE0F09C